MSGATLWLSFLEDADFGPAPRLRTGPGPDGPEIELTDRARWVLAAISLPRELAPETTSDEHQRARLGSRQWTSGEIIARIPYQHRSTIRLGLSDLRDRLRRCDLVLEDFLLIDTERGRYGVRAGQITIDLVDLYEVRHDPEAIDRRLDDAVADRRAAQLAPVCSHLLAEEPLRELETAIGASALRAVRPGLVAVAPAAPEDPGGATAEPEREPADRATDGPGADPAHRRRRVMLGRALAALVVVAAASAVIPMLASGHHRRIHALGPPRREVSGGVAHTWSDPQLAGGRSGPEIMPRQSVLIACRLRGFKVPDGNVWWYLLASRPWSQHYYATADTFYNNGHTSGSLRGSKFVDLKVALCS